MSYYFFGLCIVNNLIAQSCEDEPKNKNCNEPQPTTLSDKVIRICKNCRFGGSIGTCISPSCDLGDICRAPDDKKRIKSDPVFRVLKFSTFFRESTIYDFGSNPNQHDWNKLMRIFSK